MQTTDQGWSIRIIAKYTLFQLPGLALLILILLGIRNWWKNLPEWLFWLIIVLWVLKDMMLFPFVRRAYDSSASCDPNAMMGMRGIAKERLAPSGYIQIRGELWRAELPEGHLPIERGEYVRVREIRGLRLVVHADEEKRVKKKTADP